jgi:hypothetical protein
MATPQTTSPGRAAERWSRRAAAASGDYRSGVEQTSRSWASAAGAAKQTWQQGVTAAAGRDAYGKGVAKAGDARWKRNTIEKGPDRFAQGVQVAAGDFAQAIGPVLETIGRVDLPPRGPRGSAGNYNRVQAIGAALSRLRTGS